MDEVQRRDQAFKAESGGSFSNSSGSLGVRLEHPGTAADALTPFGVEARYPSDAPEVLPGGEVETIDMARAVRNAVMIVLQPYLDQE